MPTYAHALLHAHAHVFNHARDNACGHWQRALLLKRRADSGTFQGVCKTSAQFVAEPEGGEPFLGVVRHAGPS